MSEEKPKNGVSASEDVVKTPEDTRVSESSDSEHDPQFSPIITLPEVEVSTNEENEIEFLKIRAKLYRFDSSLETPEWKERGTGELKILRHKETSAFRIVMRRDKTFKVCANHFITPWIELKPSIGSDKAFLYTVLADFADEMPRAECLAVKFATVDNANIFKTKFEEAKKILVKECDLYNGKCDKEIEEAFAEAQEEDETKDITKKIEELDVKSEKE